MLSSQKKRQKCRDQELPHSNTHTSLESLAEDGACGFLSWALIPTHMPNLILLNLV